MGLDELERAREHCFMAGVGDTGSELCAANVPYGLAKIHHVQRLLGLPPDATFVGAPDATVTRNDARWGQGFGYGGAYAWSGDFAVLDVKPNACGMLAGALPAFPEHEEVRANLRRLAREPAVLDGVVLDNDLTESNHFVDVFEAPAEGQVEPPPGGARWFFIMHTSGHEHRGPSPRGPGLYYDESADLRARARRFDTPWGSLSVLAGPDAADWHAFYKRVEDFNHRRREALARALFGPFTTVVNATHQGLTRGVSRANIGCYTFEDPAPGAEPLFPLTLSPTLPAYLVRARANFSDAIVDRLGWRPRVDRHRLAERIAGTNLLPHGGGYTYPMLRGIGRVLEDGPDARRFELLPADPDAPTQVIRSPRELSYGYRGGEVLQRLEELELGRAVVRLDLKYVLAA